MNIIEVTSLSELASYLKNHDRLSLLLYKKGSEQSDCAYKNLTQVDVDTDVFVADVSKVRDIHPEYGITSAPSFLEFKGDKLLNVYKGCHEKNFFKNILQNAVYKSAAGDEEQPQKRVTVYSTPTCSWCNRLKTYFDMKGVRYTDIDVSKDQRAAEEMVKKSGQQGVPQTDINGEIIVGFDQKRIDTLLGLK